MGVYGWLVSYLFRWFPHKYPTGLYEIGSPDKNSPVIVTANFSLTVKKVKEALKGRSVWLLVSNSDGINVWCAAAGGIFTENRIIDSIKITELAEKVKHRKVVLPALAAPGIDIREVKRVSGFKAVFGPVNAADIPKFLDDGYEKTEEMKRFKFDLRHRLDMLFSMNFIVYLIPAVVLAIFWPQFILGYTILFWLAAIVLYSFIPYLPGRSGWSQSMLLACLIVMGWILADLFLFHDPLKHWGWLIALIAVFMAVGFDLAGIATGRKSDPEQILLKLGIKKIGTVFNDKGFGNIAIDRKKCVGCGACFNICPVKVFKGANNDKKMIFGNPGACFACGACVKQCPSNAIYLRDQ